VAFAVGAAGIRFARAVQLPTQKTAMYRTDRRQSMPSANTYHSGRCVMETFFIALGVIVLAGVAVWLFVFEPRRKIYDL
jgi:hypothetical protein